MRTGERRAHPLRPAACGAIRSKTSDPSATCTLAWKWKASKRHDPDAVFPETQWVRASVAPERTMRVSLWNALFAAVCSGLGAALLSPLVAEKAGLVRVPIDAPLPPPYPLYLVCHRALRAVPRVAALRAWLVAQSARFLGEG